MGNFKIPIDVNGKIVWNPKYGTAVDYIENCSFNAWLTFKYADYSGGKPKFMFESHDGTKQYEVFADDLEPMINYIEHGKIAGSFEYTRHGTHYGIKLICASI